MLDKLEREHVSKLVLSDYLYIKNKYIMLSADQELRPKCHHGGPCLPGAKRLFVNVDVDIERNSPVDILLERALLIVEIYSLLLGKEFWTNISTVEYKDKILLSPIIL